MRMVEFKRIKDGKVCPDKSTLYPPSKDLPFQWLNSGLKLTHAEISLIDLAGYVVDFRESGKITAIMENLEYPYSDFNDINRDSLNQYLNNSSVKNDWKLRIKIADIFKIQLYIILWPINYPYEKDESIKNPIFILRASTANGIITTKLIEKGDLNEFESFIKKLRNGYSFQRVKPLNSAKTYMECYLANRSGSNKNPWPGDLDGILIDNDTNEIKVLLEFKTHNLDTPIREEDSGKYGTIDERRFRVLTICQGHVGRIQSEKPLILFIVWGTKPAHEKIKIQAILDNQLLGEKYIKRPDSSDENELNDYATAIINFISEVST